MYLTTTMIIATVSHYFEIDPKNLQSKDKHRKYTEPRQLCITLFRLILDMTWKQSAGVFSLNYATGIHARKIWQILYITQPDKRDLFNKVVNQITCDTQSIVSRLMADDRYIFIAKRKEQVCTW